MVYFSLEFFFQILELEKFVTAGQCTSQFVDESGQTYV